MTTPRQPGCTLVSHSLSQTKRLTAQVKPGDVIVLAPGEHGTRQPRGFATMDPKRRSEISSLGGKVAHKAGGAHEWTSTEAAAAGKKGGSAVRARSGGDCHPTSDSAVNVLASCRRKGCGHFTSGEGLCRCHREAAKP